MRVGIVGLGEIGRLRARAVAATPGLELVAVADSRPDAAAPAGVRRYLDHRDLLEADVDAVIVSTPPDSHAEIALAALQAGKHVLCEKPLAPSLEDCRRILDEARQRSLTLAVGFNQRFFPAVDWVKRRIQAGDLGEIRRVRAYAGHRGLEEFRNRWEYDPKVIGGGTLMDNGIHLIDHVRYLGGEIQAVSAMTSNQAWGLPGAEDSAALLLRAQNGRWATIETCWDEWRGYRFAVEVHGERGVARVSYGPMFASVTTSDKPGSRARTERRFFPAVALREKWIGWQSTVVHTFEREMVDFLRRVRGESADAAEGFDGCRAVEIAQAAYRSAAEGREIPLGEVL